MIRCPHCHHPLGRVDIRWQDLPERDREALLRQLSVQKSGGAGAQGRSPAGRIEVERDEHGAVKRTRFVVNEEG